MEHRATGTSRPGPTWCWPSSGTSSTRWQPLLGRVDERRMETLRSWVGRFKPTAWPPSTASTRCDGRHGRDRFREPARRTRDLDLLTAVDGLLQVRRGRWTVLSRTRWPNGLTAISIARACASEPPPAGRYRRSRPATIELPGRPRPAAAPDEGQRFSIWAGTERTETEPRTSTFRSYADQRGARPPAGTGRQVQLAGGEDGPAGQIDLDTLRDDDLHLAEPAGAGHLDHVGIGQHLAQVQLQRAERRSPSAAPRPRSRQRPLRLLSLKTVTTRSTGMRLCRPPGRSARSAVAFCSSCRTSRRPRRNADADAELLQRQAAVAAGPLQQLGGALTVGVGDGIRHGRHRTAGAPPVAY